METLVEDVLGVYERGCYREFMQRAEAVKEDVRIKAAVGRCYLKGWGVSRDEKRALALLASIKDEILACARKGDAFSQNTMGNWIGEGINFQQNESESTEWYRKSAEQGNARAQYNLGDLYRMGRGVAKDETVAVEWYRKSAEQGHTPAQCNLGVVYAYGRGVAKDEAAAVEWYRKSAEQGYARA